MKNADKPAMPCEDIVERDEKGNLYGPLKSGLGLTKREYFAAMAMQGLSSSEYSGCSPEQLAANAVINADALLAELEKTQCT